MAITETTILQGSSATNGTSFTTASGSPTANRLQKFAIEVSFVSAQSTRPTLTVNYNGTGLTFVQVAADSGHFNESGTGNKFNFVYLFRAMGSSPTSGTITIDSGATTMDSAAWSWCESGNVDQSGTNGSGAVVQSAANQADSASSLTVTLGSFSSTNNATYGVFGAGDTSGTPRTWTSGTGFTELHDTGSEYASIGAEWRNDNDTSVDATASASSSGLGGVAIELKHLLPYLTLTKYRYRNDDGDLGAPA